MVVSGACLWCLCDVGFVVLWFRLTAWFRMVPCRIDGTKGPLPRSGEIACEFLYTPRTRGCVAFDLRPRSASQSKLPGIVIPALWSWTLDFSFSRPPTLCVLLVVNTVYCLRLCPSHPPVIILCDCVVLCTTDIVQCHCSTPQCVLVLPVAHFVHVVCFYTDWCVCCPLLDVSVCFTVYYYT